MNSLGRGWLSCLNALRNYHRGVRALRRHAREARSTGAARVQLDDLLFQLDVDIAARGGAAGRSRMTEVERAVLLPALVGVRTALRGIRPELAPSAWSGPLDASLALLRGAVPGLRRWRTLAVGRAAAQ